MSVLSSWLRLLVAVDDDVVLSFKETCGANRNIPTCPHLGLQQCWKLTSESLPQLSLISHRGFYYKSSQTQISLELKIPIVGHLIQL